MSECSSLLCCVANIIVPTMWSPNMKIPQATAIRKPGCFGLSCMHSPISHTKIGETLQHLHLLNTNKVTSLSCGLAMKGTVLLVPNIPYIYFVTDN